MKAGAAVLDGFDKQKIPADELDRVIVVSAGLDHSIKFWDGPTGEVMASVNWGIKSQINDLQISPDKKLMAVSGNPAMKIYDIRKVEPVELANYSLNCNCIQTAFTSSSDIVLAGSEDSYCHMFDLRSHRKQPQRSFVTSSNGKSKLTCMVLSPADDGFLMTGDEKGQIRIWDLRGSTTLLKYELVPDIETKSKFMGITSVAISPHGKIVAATNGAGKCFTWVHQDYDFDPMKKFEDHGGKMCLKAKFSPDGSKFATCGSDGLINVYDAEEKWEKTTLKGHSKWVYDIDFSSDGMYLFSGSSDRTCKLWSMQDGQYVVNFVGHFKSVTSVALNDATFANDPSAESAGKEEFQKSSQ